MGMFRRMGPSDEQARLRRVMPLGSKAWLTITDTAEGLLVRSSDLLPDSGKLQAFEEERDLLRRPASSIGASPRYDRDAMYAWLTWFLFEKGVPDTQRSIPKSCCRSWLIRPAKARRRRSSIAARNGRMCWAWVDDRRSQCPVAARDLLKELRIRDVPRGARNNSRRGASIPTGIDVVGSLNGYTTRLRSREALRPSNLFRD